MSLLGINKRGKLVVGGIVAFALIATASTGLAAWVIGTQNNGSTEEGTITVSPVKDTSIDITVNDGGEYDINFAPAVPGEGEEFKVITHDGNDGTEDLDFSFSFSVSAGEAASFTHIRVHMYAADEDSATIINAAVSGNYIKYPSEFYGEGASAGTIAVIPEEVEKADLSASTVYFDIAKEDDGTYEYAGKFQWGSLTAGINPCRYFDGTTGKDYDAAKTYLDGLTGVFGSTTEGEGEDAIEVMNKAKYHFVLEAVTVTNE